MPCGAVQVGRAHPRVRTPTRTHPNENTHHTTAHAGIACANTDEKAAGVWHPPGAYPGAGQGAKHRPRGRAARGRPPPAAAPGCAWRGVGERPEPHECRGTRPSSAPPQAPAPTARASDRRGPRWRCGSGGRRARAAARRPWSAPTRAGAGRWKRRRRGPRGRARGARGEEGRAGGSSGRAPGRGPGPDRGCEGGGRGGAGGAGVRLRVSGRGRQGPPPDIGRLGRRPMPSTASIAVANQARERRKPRPCPAASALWVGRTRHRAAAPALSCACEAPWLSCKLLIPIRSLQIHCLWLLGRREPAPTAAPAQASGRGWGCTQSLCSREGSSQCRHWSK